MFVGKWHLGTEPYSLQNKDSMPCMAHASMGILTAITNLFKTNNPFPKADKNAYLTNLIGDGAVDFINKYDKRHRSCSTCGIMEYMARR